MANDIYMRLGATLEYKTGFASDAGSNTYSPKSVQREWAKFEMP